MRGRTFAGVMILLVVATGVVAAGNERPEAGPGLDQEAIVNSTVYLDAGGSWDPDGEVVRYEWWIERPNGTITYPDCRTCSLTRFVPMQAGQYNVTVVVTDDDGGTRADTLYVMVSDPGPPSVPSVSPSTGGASGGGSVGAPSSFGSVGGGNSAQPSRIERTRDGTYVLEGRGGSVNRAFYMMVGGKVVRLSASEMQAYAADDGKVTYAEAARHFEQAGANRNDVRDDLQDSTRPGHCQGRACAFRITETSGDYDAKNSENQEEQTLQEALRNHRQNDNSDDRSNGDSANSNTESSGADFEVDIGCVMSCGGGSGGDRGSGSGIPVNIGDINPGI